MLTTEQNDKLTLISCEVDFIRALVGSQKSAMLDRNQLWGLSSLLDRWQSSIAEILTASDQEEQPT